MTTLATASWALADWQRDLAAFALHADAAAGERLLVALASGPVPALEALEIHATTVHHALYSALRQRVPTVEALVGEAFMRELTRAFARSHPPRQPQLAVWGEAFPAFVAEHAGCQALPYLAAVAAFDLALDDTALSHAGQWREPWTLAETLRLQCLDSLRIFAADFAVDQLRDAVAAAKSGDTASLENFSWASGAHHYALWCAADSQVHCRAIGAGLAAFLVPLLAEGLTEDAVERALQAALAATRTAEEDAASLFTGLLQELAGLGGARLLA